MPMKAVILAAGRGTRMQSLTDALPKPMLEVSGKSLLAHKIEALPDSVDEVVMVVGYQGEVIREAFGNSYAGKRISYVVQEELSGTASALWCAREYLTNRFVILMGDDLYAKEDIEACLSVEGWAVLVKSTDAMASGGSMVLDENRNVVAIEEGDHTGKVGVMNTNLFALDPRVFDYPLVPKAAGSSEYGLPQTVVAASALAEIPLHAIEATFWIQVTAPEDLPRAEEALLKR